MPCEESAILENLTDAQREAVTHKDGPMLVVAGAGSGKTRVVTRRIAWLIRQGVWPSQILAMTFTNKAATEMQTRVTGLVGEAPASMGTFHSCCARFLRRDLEKLPGERGRDFTIYAPEDQKGAIREVFSRHKEITPHTVPPPVLLEFIGWAKNHAVSYEKAATQARLPVSDAALELLPGLAREYDDLLRRSNALDFDDLLLLTVRLLQEVPALREVYHNRLRYLLIDEYQDTNHLQYCLMRLLANEQQNVHVTGDPDQSIYAWRGADYQNIMSFTRDFPQAKVVTLSQNYRSTPSILEAANAVIRCNTDRMEKELFTQNPPGVVVADIQTENDREEAEWIRKKITGLHRKNGMPWRNFAILYRTNAQSRSLEEELVRYGIPYQLLGGLRFYERKEVRDFLALLRFLVNPMDFQAFLRVLGAFPQGKGLGEKTAQLLQAQAEEEGLPLARYLASPRLAQRQKGRSAKAEKIRQLGAWMNRLLALPRSPVSQVVQQVEEETAFLENLVLQYGTDNLYSRQENVKSLLAKAEEFSRKSPQGDLKDFLEEVALVADVDNRDEKADCVLLMTLHSSKGLEFPCVFITGMEDGLFPCHYGDEDPEESLPEERRLFYVGLTRAQKAVFLTHAKTRFSGGSLTLAHPSPFLEEIPNDLLQKKTYRWGRELPWKPEDDLPPEIPRRNDRFRWRY